MGNLFQIIDSDGDGYISFIEFLSATLPPKELNDDASFWAAFTFFDRDGNGLIDARDLITALGCKTAEEKENCYYAMREVCPAPHDLTFEQFLHVLRNGTTPARRSCSLSPTAIKSAGTRSSPFKARW